jgi:penicillin-binding protein 2
LIVVFSFLILIARLWYLQVLNGEKWLKFAESNRIEIKRIPAMRGRILDRNGKVIADNKPAFDLKIIPSQLKPSVEEALLDIQKTLGWTDEFTKKVMQKTAVQNKHDLYTIKRDVTQDEISIMMANQFRFPGVKIVSVPTRKYVYGNMASHLLGYLGEIGKKDLEKCRSKI